MIVKVQMPMVTTEPIPMALIYNKNRDVLIYEQASILKEVMGNRLKAFFHAHISKEGILEIGDEAEWQDW